jgi:hypothetical protein
MSNTTKYQRADITGQRAKDAGHVSKGRGKEQGGNVVK